jgi:hypothetical protein
LERSTKRKFLHHRTHPTCHNGCDVGIVPSEHRLRSPGLDQQWYGGPRGCLRGTGSGATHSSQQVAQK